MNPVASGGYVWVVFTSRRLYGNVATSDPWLSDPRSYDDDQAREHHLQEALGRGDRSRTPPAGTDPSHPAFYLPAQELLAGNARGFWVLDPCKPDGQSCESGDQCCNGFCEPDGDRAPSCARTRTRTRTARASRRSARTSADCCDTTERLHQRLLRAQGPELAAPRPSAPRPSAPRLSAPRPSAPRPSAPRPSAPRPSAPRPSAPRPSAPRPSAPRPSGSGVQGGAAIRPLPTTTSSVAPGDAAAARRSHTAP